MDLTLREEYWITFCMKLITVISHDNYQSFYDSYDYGRNMMCKNHFMY
jgi:hypothetical protein